MNLKKSAHNFLDKGINILPIKNDKRPKIHSWSHLNTKLMEEEELERIKWDHTYRVGIITGTVSGGFETSDFDMKHGLRKAYYMDYINDE